MSKIIQFPLKAERDWLLIEPALREALRNAGAPQKVEDVICNRFKEAFHKYQRTWTIKLELPMIAGATQEEIDRLYTVIKEGFEHLAKQIHQYTNEILADRISLEIELYKCKEALRRL